MLVTILKLILVGLIPVTCLNAIGAIEVKGKFQILKGWKRQIVFGILFGILSIVGSELGVKNSAGVIINVRDVGPALAGLVFGMPAGIIAGFIGGFERFMAVYWGASSFTRYACSISTFLAGIFAGLVRKLVFDDHHGKWYYGFILGLFIESVHMILVLVTNLDNVETACGVIQACAIPMILANSICITAALLFSTLVRKEPLLDPERPRKITYYIQIGLTFVILLAFLMISALTSTILNELSLDSTSDTLELSVTDVKNDVEDTLDDQMLNIAKIIGKEVSIFSKTDFIDEDAEYLEFLIGLASENNLTEVNIVDSNNIIIYSNLEGNIGYDMDDNEISKEFGSLIGWETELVQEYGPTSKDSSKYMKYAGVALSNFGYVQVGYNTEDYHKAIDELLDDSTSNRHIGQSGFVFITSETGEVISSVSGLENQIVSVSQLSTDKLINVTVDGTQYYYYSHYIEGYYIVAVYPSEEADLNRLISLYVTTLNEIIIFCLLYMVIYVVIKKMIVNKIDKVNDSLEEISNGNLDVVVEQNATYEFKSLSDSINKTVVSLKNYANEAAKKMEADLQLAKNIQHSVLPSTFPPFPSHHEFDIFASMDTAKEVGGDFYDFYLVDDKHLAILIADVSGKGVPAAMFMMQAKSIIKSLVTSGMELDNAFTIANKRLCEGNDAQMFVTAWMAIINLETGHVKYVNAGHNPPLVGRKDSGFEFIKGKAGFVLAGMDGLRYRLQDFYLGSGDQIYLYTDGVTEANNKEQKLYGDNRLVETANKAFGLSAEGFCQSIMDDVVSFEDGAEQFDDITMLSVIFHGKRNLEEYKTPAIVKNGEGLIDFINNFLEKNDASMKAITQIDVAVDEIFSNIAFYAYKEGNSGKVNVTIEAVDNYVIITFEDHGVEYNPLLNEDPDITLSAEDREIGGLGIYIVKKTMDEVNYVNRNGRNLLTIKKTIK